MISSALFRAARVLDNLEIARPIALVREIFPAIWDPSLIRTLFPTILQSVLWQTRNRFFSQAKENNFKGYVVIFTDSRSIYSNPGKYVK